MSRLRCRLAFSFLLLFLSFSIHAQEIDDTGENKTDPVVEKKALDLLETVASKLSTIKSAENRISLTCKVANLIWTRDEKRARALFENVTKDVVEMVGTIDLSDQQAYNTLSIVNQVRQEAVGTLAQRDPDLALSFLKATRMPAESPMAQTYERNLELYLSRMIVGRDPERALKLARESLSRGLSYEMASMLSDLQRKSPEAAQKLYESVIDRVKAESFSRNQDAANIACNILSSFVPPQASEPLYKDFLETVIKSAMSMPGDAAYMQQVQNLQNNLRSSLPMVEKYLPAQAEAFKRWSTELRRTDPYSQMYNEMNELVQKGSVDDVLALASKYPPEMRVQIYQQAAWKASNSGDDVRARQIANDFVTDPVTRRQILEQLNNQAFWKVLNENKIDEARAMLGRSLPTELRLQLLERLATMLLQKEDKKVALDCLNEAKTLVAEMPRSSQKIWQQFQLSGMYFQVDPKEGFTIIAPIIAQTNELVGAAAVMDGFDNRYLQDGEWIPNGHSPIGSLVVQLRQVLAQSSRYDFDRAEALAEQLERPEIRLQAQVDIAQVALSGEQQIAIHYFPRMLHR